jgi:hypothetical protein
MSALDQLVERARHLVQLADRDLDTADQQGGIVSDLDHRDRVVPYVELAEEHLRKAMGLLEQAREWSP